MAVKSFDKIIEDISNLSVIELADLVSSLEKKFGVSAAMPVAAAAPAAASGVAAAPAEEKSSYKVTLKDAGSEKIKVIKALRQVIPGLGLTEAKEKAEGAPIVLVESAPKADAEKIKKDLEAAGAKVELA